MRRIQRFPTRPAKMPTAIPAWSWLPLSLSIRPIPQRFRQLYPPLCQLHQLLVRYLPQRLLPLSHNLRYYQLTLGGGHRCSRIQRCICVFDNPAGISGLVFLTGGGLGGSGSKSISLAVGAGFSGASTAFTSCSITHSRCVCPALLAR